MAIFISRGDCTFEVIYVYIYIVIHTERLERKASDKRPWTLGSAVLQIGQVDFGRMVSAIASMHFGANVCGKRSMS